MNYNITISFHAMKFDFSLAEYRLENIWGEYQKYLVQMIWELRENSLVMVTVMLGDQI